MILNFFYTSIYTYTNHVCTELTTKGSLGAFLITIFLKYCSIICLVLHLWYYIIFNYTYQ